MKEDLKNKMISVIGSYKSPLIDSIANNCADVAIEFFNKKEEANNLWEVYSNHGKGIKAHIQAETAKEAIDKFENKFREQWINRPYSILSVVYLGVITK